MAKTAIEYKQTKKADGLSRKVQKSRAATSTKSKPEPVAVPVDDATSAKSKPAEPRAAVAVADVAAELRRFDLDAKFGPCAGLTRLERWERAKQLGLEPPVQIRELLDAGGEQTSVFGRL
jgi:DNA polymerase delta subunit 4